MAKKITYKNLAALINNDNNKSTIDVTIGDSTFSVDVKKAIDMESMVHLVNDAASSIVNIDDGTYTPELSTFLTKLLILHYYAGFPIPDKDIGKAYDVICMTDLFDQVSKHISHHQLGWIFEYVDDHVSYLRDFIVSTSSMRTTALLNGIDGIVEQLNSIGEEIDVKGLSEALISLTDSLGVDNKSARAVADNIVKLPRKVGNNGKTN